jgi:alpha-1,2-mannosyltransferase
MSFLTRQAGIVAQPSVCGKTPIEELYVKLTVAAAVFLVALQVSYLIFAALVPPDHWIANTNFVVGRDFLNTWMGGRSFFSGGPAPWFDYRVYNQALQHTFGPTYPQGYWSYPPHVVLFVWPLGLMPYAMAYIAWCLAGVASYLYASSRVIPRDRLLFVAVAPGIAVCAFFGQNGFYTAALLIGGLFSLDRRPILAGVLFGILTIKPQLGLLLPVVLLLERRWLTVAAAIVTSALLVAVTGMLFGWNVWLEFWQKVVPQQVWLTENSNGLLYAMVGTLFYAARMLFLPLKAAWAIQYAASAFCLAAVVWTYWKRRDRDLSFALLITATFLFTPYILNYDMVIFGFIAALLRDRADNTEYDHKLYIAVWALPVAMMLAGFFWIPLAPIVLVAFAWRLLVRLKRGSAGETRPLALSTASAAA